MNHIFLLKMALFVLILALEAWPMIMLIKWRREAAKGPARPCSLGVSSEAHRDAESRAKRWSWC